MVVLGAVGQAVPLEEGIGADLFLAARADEVLRMPGLAQGMDHLGEVASLTQDHNGVLQAY